ncbi:MAG: type II toxin-antitoxin system VapC family toxin [Stellaceae bacterium]
MRLLLDTQIFLWWASDSPRLSPALRDAIAADETDVFVSIASAWEIEIKRAIGKLWAPSDFRAALEMAVFTLLPIELRHIEALVTLPLHHRDPFDRMLIAQASVEGMALASADDAFRRYGIVPLR